MDCIAPFTIVRTLAAFVAGITVSGAIAATPPAPTATTDASPILRAKVGAKLTIDLAGAPEVPVAWTNVRYHMVGASRDGRFVAQMPELSFSNLIGRLEWTPEPAQAGRYDLLFIAAPDPSAMSVIRRQVEIATPAVTTDTSPLGKRLTEWWTAGTAAGLVGDYYDNHDGAHSTFDVSPLPQLSRIVYSDEHKQRGMHVGAQLGIFNHVTIGNSSMSAPAGAGGCLVRTLTLGARTTDVLAAQYRRSHLYIYPEHQDHDPGHNGRGGGYGDLLPANIPYAVISQGSSGSDKPFLKAFIWTLASFRPEVKRVLTEQGLLMPAMQMIFRTSNTNAAAPADYFTGKAHPTVFEGGALDIARMMEQAQAMRTDTLPPLVQLRVVEEDLLLHGRDFFDPGADEEIFTTPQAVARVFRGAPHSRRMVVSAESSHAVNGRIEEYRWTVLRGGADGVRITPLNKEGSRVEIRVDHPLRRPIAPGSRMESARIDIGAFARVGKTWSAPAFVTWTALDNEARTYGPDGRIVDIGYDAGDTAIDASDIRDWAAVADAVLSDGKDDAPALLRSVWPAGDLAALRDAAPAIRQAAAATTNPADKALSDLLKAPLSKAKGSFEGQVVSAFNTLKNDLQFSERAATALAALPDATRSGDLARERRRMATMGIARIEDERPVWTSVQGGIDKLTVYERNRIERYHLTALRALFPKVVGRTFRVNLVDNRLTLPKAWRDVYRYDAAGRLTGWDRHEGDEVKRFTADGRLVTESDKLGRPTATRAMIYLRQQSDPKKPAIEALPGPTTHHTYENDQDFTGRTVP